jgi:hypothetical protein
MEVCVKGLIIIPFVDCYRETLDAFGDALPQLESATDILLVDQGSTDPDVRQWTEFVSRDSARVRLWRHAPPLPSLAATWNQALDYAWAAGYPDAMVWNNDIRVAPHMYEALREVAKLRDLWFATPVNCATSGPGGWNEPCPDYWDVTLGGPDFSCFLISRTCHEKYRFDERFQPAYHEDGDYHRRMWLGGDGGKIAGVTLPYLHYGSRTIHRSEEALQAFQPQFAACRARYVAKWGGEPHHERKITPDSAEDFDGVGTPGGYLDRLLHETYHERVEPDGCDLPQPLPGSAPRG